jgi:hypothetical protein
MESGALWLAVEQDGHSRMWACHCCVRSRRDFSFNISQLSIADSTGKCNRVLFVTSPQRGEMFIAQLLFLNRTLRRSAISYGYLASDSAARYISLLKEREII